MSDNPKLNSEGYFDPTAYGGIRSILREENALDRDANMLIKVLKYIINKAGFELVNRIEIKDRKSGKAFK